MLQIENLHVSVQDENEKTKQILRGLTLHVRPGETHAVMGPNGSGKSTLSKVLAGREGYTINEGSLRFEGVELQNLSPEERALRGLFLAFQYPVEIPGVNNTSFLRAALNKMREKRGEKPLDALDFLVRVKKTIKEVGLDEAFLNRAVNEGFSGGEKKRNEILQMLMLEPKLIVLDEIDSGLDIDALQDVARCITSLRDQGRSFILVTHYQRLLDYIVPDHIHVMTQGKIIKSGDKSLALELEQKGYRHHE